MLELNSESIVVTFPCLNVHFWQMWTTPITIYNFTFKKLHLDSPLKIWRTFFKVWQPYKGSRPLAWKLPTEANAKKLFQHRCLFTLRILTHCTITIKIWFSIHEYASVNRLFSYDYSLILTLRIFYHTHLSYQIKFYFEVEKKWNNYIWDPIVSH